MSGLSVVMIRVFGCRHRRRRRSRAHFHGVRVTGSVAVGTMGHMGAGHA
jgi:hypothetical protein